MPLPRKLALWNRKLHYYVGLYLLAFVWLFSLSGLLLNHSWVFTDFWPQRKTATFERNIEAPRGADDTERAAGLLRQLGLSGEIGSITTRPDGAFEVQAARPGTMYRIKADLTAKRASVESVEVNGWGVVRILHTFTGVERPAGVVARDWLLTKIWSFSMDAVSAGLAFLVLSSVYLWWERRGKRVTGLLALTAGLLSCAFFAAGLRAL